MPLFVKYCVLSPDATQEALERSRQEFIQANADADWLVGSDGCRPMRTLEGAVFDGYDKACAFVDQYAIDHGNGYDDVAVRFRDTLETYKRDQVAINLRRRLSRHGEVLEQKVRELAKQGRAPGDDGYAEDIAPSEELILGIRRQLTRYPRKSW